MISEQLSSVDCYGWRLAMFSEEEEADGKINVSQLRWNAVKNQWGSPGRPARPVPTQSRNKDQSHFAMTFCLFNVDIKMQLHCEENSQLYDLLLERFNCLCQTQSNEMERKQLCQCQIDEGSAIRRRERDES